MLTEKQLEAAIERESKRAKTLHQKFVENCNNPGGYQAFRNICKSAGAACDSEDRVKDLKKQLEELQAQSAGN